MKTSHIKLLVGLGNPGKKYSNTRHNVGFMVLYELASKNLVTFKKNKKFHGFIGELAQEDKKSFLLLPDTYMNDSGRAVRATMDWYGLKESQLLVLADDMDLPLGKLRLRAKGSSGGHNGLKSIIENIGTQHFKRIKIGIGSPSNIPSERRIRTNSHVLGSFSSMELDTLKIVIKKVVRGIDFLQNENWEKAGTFINSEIESKP